MDYARSIPCPGHEFGLDPCEEKITQRGRSTGGGYFDPPEWDEEEDLDPPCGCDKKLSGEEEKKFWVRVWEELDKKEFEVDYDYGDY